jgi:hypothetical protein
MATRLLKTSVGSVYADFGLSISELLRCELCGIFPHKALYRDGQTLTGFAVPISSRCPVAGLVGLCKACSERFGTGIFEGPVDGVTGAGESLPQSWTPPPLIQPVPGAPLYLIKRGITDDERLARCIAATWQRVPEDARLAMTTRWLSSEKDANEGALGTGALRIEALPHWEGRTQAMGMCLNRGRAIRLLSCFVDAAPDNHLKTIIAHELAHCFQDTADWVEPETTIEEDAIEIMADWGFRNADIHDWLLRIRVLIDGLSNS